MAAGPSTEQRLQCACITGCEITAVWWTSEPAWPGPPPSYVELELRESGWIRISDYMGAPPRWLCPEHARQRNTAVIRLAGRPAE